MATVKLGNPTPSRFWHWPDRTISKGESKVMREEHNRLAQQHHDLLAALQLAEKGLEKLYGLTGHESDRLNLEQIRNAIAKATGG